VVDEFLWGELDRLNEATGYEWVMDVHGTYEAEPVPECPICIGRYPNMDGPNGWYCRSVPTTKGPDVPATEATRQTELDTLDEAIKAVGEIVSYIRAEVLDETD